MYFYKVIFVLVITSVLSEVLWYPAAIAENTLAKKLNRREILNKQFISSTGENDDISLHKWYTKNITKMHTSRNETVGVSHNNFNRNVFDTTYADEESSVATTKAGFYKADNYSIKSKNFELNSTNSLWPWKDYFKNGELTRTDREKSISKDVTKKSRFLDVFQVVEFAHAACTSSTGLEGKCLHLYECQSVGGSPMGSCADDVGICCVIVFPCYGQTSSQVGWFTNPEYPLPSTGRLSCALTVYKTSQDIKQIRLDFTIFELLPPTGGTCEHDQFVISGQNVNNVIPILCGINTGQHVYIEVGYTKGPIRLTVQTIASENRLFSIKVTQLTKSDILAAPAGCLQYFHGPYAVIESFNYRNITEVEIPTHQSYLNNLNYAICIERERASCSITYTNENDMQIVNYDTDGLPIIPPRQAGVEIFNCPSDWLLMSAARLCGERLNDGSVLQDFYLNAPVNDISAGPITIWFRSDEGYVGRGFRIQYQQNPCTVTS